MRFWKNGRSCTCRIRGRGPQRHNPGLTLGLQQAAYQSYMRAIYHFVLFCALVNLEPETCAEFDDLIIEHASGEHSATGPLTKSQLTTLVAAVERILPHTKGELMMSRALISSWSVAWKPRHAVPLEPHWAALLALQLCWAGMPMVGGLLYLQASIGLRPSEGLGLRIWDILLPYEVPKAMGAALLLLGVKKGTKSGRPQAVRVTAMSLITLLTVLKWAASQNVATNAGFLTGVRTLAGYTWCLNKAMQMANVKGTGWSAHSGRAGYITSQHVAGTPPGKIAEVTRHVSLKSLKIYIDVTAVTAGNLATTLAPRLNEALQAESTILPLIQSMVLGS